MSFSSAKVRAIPLTELDGQAAEVVRLVHEQREPVALTRGGNRLAVVLSPEVFDRMQDAVEGHPVAELAPDQKRQWVPRADYARVLAAAPEAPAFFDDIADMGDGPLDLDRRGAGRGFALPAMRR
jgi:prevent-host-death family protein